LKIASKCTDVVKMRQQLERTRTARQSN